ncbi:MAG: hypothetical protein WCO83_02275 [Alphaproteobacteria bacterium]
MIGWRFWTGLGAVAVFFGLIFAVYYYHGAATKAERKAQDARAQAANNAETVKQVDHYNQTTTIIREKTDAGVQAIQAAPGADTPLPDGVRDSWRSSIVGMRDDRPAAENHSS